MENLGDYEYSKKDLIGHGAFAVVFKGRVKKNCSHPVAIKCVTKKNLAKSQSLLSKEIKILKELSSLHHENVVSLLDCKETSHHVYLVMEYCNGGDLADYLQAKGTLSEDTISTFLRQIAGAMKALNAKGVVHRDLKPQNILLQTPVLNANPPTKDIILKIADFGFARFLQDGVMAATLCGSPMYMAPEVIMSWQYGAKADLWSIGTIAFQCLTGKAPFQAQTPQQLKTYYEQNNNLMPRIPNGTSPELRDLLTRMLKRNAADRIDFEDFFSHAFLQVEELHRPTSPVAVPSRKRLNSDSPPMKEVKASPLSRHMTPSPSNDRECNKNKKTSDSLPELGGEYVKVDGDVTPKSGSPTEDFVMVPEHFAESSGSVIMTKTLESTNMVLESSGSQSSTNPPLNKTLKVDTVSGAAVYTTKNTDPETSPSRPSSLLVKASPSPPTQAIPVPTQVKAYEKMRKNSSPVSPNSQSQNSSKDMGTSVTSPLASPDRGQSKTSSASKQRSKTQPLDIGSLSPPNVKFMFGTPENWFLPGRSRSISTPTPPSSYGSPIKKLSGVTPPRPSPNTPPLSGPSSLPTIAGSPKLYRGRSPLSGAASPFSALRNRTFPDNVVSLNEGGAEGGSYVEPHNLVRMGSTPKLNEDILLRAAFGNTGSSKSPPYGAMMPYGSKERHLSERQSSFERSDAFARRDSFPRTRSSQYTDTSPSSLPFAQSPPNMEGPIMFVAPCLNEETLMEQEHNDTVKKLQFVMDFVKEITELARMRASPLSESVLLSKDSDRSPGNLTFGNDDQRTLDQLVLYARALHFLSSSLELAKTEIKANRLQPSNTVTLLLKEMTASYHKGLDHCKSLTASCGKARPLRVSQAGITADKLIYNYAIEMCQTAALEEMFGNPSECFRRYQTAQTLLHALSQQSRVSRDRHLLEQYKTAVEGRLLHLERQGIVISNLNG